MLHDCPASGHTSPISESALADPDRDPDELATIITQAYHEHVETMPPLDTELAVSSGLLGSPFLGTSTRVTADWCHAWSVLGQWSGWVTFPVPESEIWPRHGHLRGIPDGFQGRQPNFHKWARPAYEQGGSNSCVDSLGTFTHIKGLSFDNSLPFLSSLKHSWKAEG